MEVKLGICIPIYNHEIGGLASVLRNQIKKLNHKVCLLAIDDASDIDFKTKNKNYKNLFDNYIELNENIGRSKIRNLFLRYTENLDWLLFLDCDAIIVENNFILNYINAIQAEKAEVICGGRKYGNKPTDNNYMLNWNYGSWVESLLNTDKNKIKFHSNNFAIKRIIFEQIQFDEQIVGYGYEDIAFGFKLREKEISIVDIDNNIHNHHLETNEKYLKKTEEAIRNLFLISSREEYKNINKLVSLTQTHNNLDKLYLTKFVYYILNLVAPMLKKILIKFGKPLLFFQLYKLWLYNKANIVSKK